MNEPSTPVDAIQDEIAIALLRSLIQSSLWYMPRPDVFCIPIREMVEKKTCSWNIYVLYHTVAS